MNNMFKGQRRYKILTKKQRIGILDVEAAFWWGFVGGGALVLGAAVGYLFQVSNRVIAGVMAFGSGVLISARLLSLNSWM